MDQGLAGNATSPYGSGGIPRTLPTRPRSGLRRRRPSRNDAWLRPPEPRLDPGNLPRQRDEVRERGLRLLAEVAAGRLVAFDVDAQGRSGRVRARQAEPTRGPPGDQQIALVAS